MPNPTYRVPITRDVTETTYIEVQSETPETAVRAALNHARCCPHLLTWDIDEGNVNEKPYFAGMTDYSAVEDVTHTRFCVDGHEADDIDSPFIGDGQFPPFVVFDIEAQDNLPGTYPTRSDAQEVADRLNKAILRG